MNALEELRSAVDRFADLLSGLEGASEDLAVEACPGWTVRDLAVHLGTVHRWAAAIVLSGQSVTEPEPLVEGPLRDWYAGCGGALIAALGAVAPAEPIPNFARLDQTASFWPRRQLHETTVHAVDLAQALGHAAQTWQVPAQVAADGIAEVLRVMFGRMTMRGQRPQVDAPIRLQATDTGQSWVVSPGAIDPTTVVLRASTVPADSTISGTVSDLYLALWGRVGRDRLSVDGEHAEAMLAGPLTP